MLLLFPPKSPPLPLKIFGAKILLQTFPSNNDLRIKYISHLKKCWKDFDNTIKITIIAQFKPYLNLSEIEHLFAHTPDLAAYAPHPDFDSRPWHHSFYFHLTPQTANLSPKTAIYLLPSRFVTHIPVPKQTPPPPSPPSETLYSSVAAPNPTTSTDRSLLAFDSFISSLSRRAPSPDSSLPPTRFDLAPDINDLDYDSDSKTSAPSHHDESIDHTAERPLTQKEIEDADDADDSDWEEQYASDMSEDSHTTLSDAVLTAPKQTDNFIPSPPPLPESISTSSHDSDFPDAQQPEESQDLLTGSPQTNLFISSLLDICPHDKLPTLRGLIASNALPFQDLQSLVNTWQEDNTYDASL
jgi:hypothetical protein